MLEVFGDLFVQKCDSICITTNGYVNPRGQNTMGAGVALAAVKKAPELPYVLGEKLQLHGNRVYRLTDDAKQLPLQGKKQQLPYHLVSFPTKPTWAMRGELLPRYQQMGANAKGQYPGWMAKSNLELIYCSALELMRMVNAYKWERVCLPRPGCSNGQLRWFEEVKPVISEVFDDRFVIVDLARR